MYLPSMHMPSMHMPSMPMPSMPMPSMHMPSMPMPSMSMPSMPYFFLILILIYGSICTYIRLKAPFWHSQPVFHIYNLRYWFNPPGYINKTVPAANKFVNLVNNRLITVAASDVDSLQITKICNFIKDYYVMHPTAAYKPTEEDIIAYLQSTNQPAFFNVYQEPKLLFESGGGLSNSTVDQEIIGVASARVLNVTLFKGGKLKNKINVPAYYVDHLCVKPGYRKKGIPPQMIQTFYYNVARTNKKVNAYLFKREGKGNLNAIVPLVGFDTYNFSIGQFATAYVLNQAMSLIEIGAQQLNVFSGFVKEQMPKFECVVLPDVSSVLNLIKLGKLVIYGILLGGELLAAYVFRPLELYYGMDKTVECISIISNCKTADVLIAGFNMSLLKVKNKCKVNILLIEETAHSPPVIASLLTNPTVSCNFKSPTAFFFYNYACHSVKNKKILLVY